MNFSELIYLIPLLPLAGFLFNGLLRNYLSKTIAAFVGSISILLAFGLSVGFFLQSAAPDFVPVSADYFTFFHAGDIQFSMGFMADRLTAIFLLIITGVGFLIHLYSAGYMKEEPVHSFARFFSFLNLFVFSMLLLVLGNSFLIMFIGWEGVGLCSYLLIGFWYGDHENNKAANKAFVMNRIGDVGFLLALFWLLSLYGSLNFAELFGPSGAIVAEGQSATALTGITLLLLLGATGKSAQIPLYTWLPDAMAGPTPVSALIHAATMVTAGIYMIARSNLLFVQSPFTMVVIAVIGITTALLTALIALKQYDIKKILAYSTVSQLGYMFLALGLGAFSAAVFHVMTHAFFKALLFLGAGSVIHALGGVQDIRQMGGMGTKMNITSITFLIACLAIAGIPPLSGFFSKDEILMAAYSSNPLLYILGVLGALLTAVYMFRLFAMTFSGKYRGDYPEAKVHESPSVMTIPLIVLAILSIIGGWVGIPEIFMKDADSFGTYLDPVFSASHKFVHAAHLSENTEWLLMGLSTILVVIAAIWSWKMFTNKSGLQPSRGLALIMQNRFYVDEGYRAIVIKPMLWCAAKFQVVDRRVIDGFVNGIGRVMNYGSRQLRYLQSGQTASYIFLMVVGTILLFVIWFVAKP